MRCHQLREKSCLVTSDRLMHACRQAAPDSCPLCPHPEPDTRLGCRTLNMPAPHHAAMHHALLPAQGQQIPNQAGPAAGLCTWGKCLEVTT